MVTCKLDTLAGRLGTLHGTGIDGGMLLHCRA
jgi:hypothetical protein